MADIESVEIEPVTTPLTEAVTRPISADNPCGEDVTYDDDFQAMKAEIDQLSTLNVKVDQEKALSAMSGKRKQDESGESESILTETAAVDFDRLIRLGSGLLTTKTRDLRVAGYLAFGLSRMQGFAGMAEGICVVNTVIDHFWEDLYPAKRRMVARRNAIQFLAERLKEQLEAGGNPAIEDGLPLAQVQDQLKTLQARTMELMEENAPVLSGVVKAAGDLLRKVPRPEPEPAGEPEEPASADVSAEGDGTADEVSADIAPDAGASAPAAPPAPKKSGTAPPASEPASRPASKPATAAPDDSVSAADAAQRIIRMAAMLRGENPGDPASYRVLRVVRWNVLDSEPPHENGKTKLDPPLERRREYLSGLLERGEYEELLTEAEASFQEKPFHLWLDLQRLVASALEALGVKYAAAHEAVLIENAVLLRRIPALPALTFSDGTPFADTETREWYETRVSAILSGGEGSAGRPAAGAGSALEEQYGEAREKLVSGDVAAALAVMQNGATGDAADRTGFMRQTYAASLCLKGGRPEIAYPLYQNLDRIIEHHRLDQWDPGLAVEVWTGLHKCCDALAAGKNTANKDELRAESTRAFNNICRLDPIHGLAVAGKKV